jgi:hypothetical protein
MRMHNQAKGHYPHLKTQYVAINGNLSIEKNF